MLKLEEKIKELPPEAQRELEDFLEILISKHSKRGSRRLKLNWRGGLKELRDKYTSVELQHKALEMRVKNVSSRYKHTS